MSKSKNISEDEAREAVRTLVRWAGDDPDRAALRETPERVLQFYRNFFTGYDNDAARYTGGIANDISYNDFILIKDIRLASFCAHHMLPASGSAHVAYIPDKAVAGIGTIARLAADCARRLTTQEEITGEIIARMQEAFAPAGVAVSVSMAHGCITLRDGGQSETRIITTKFSGIFADNAAIQNRFLMYTNESRADIQAGSRD